ncbi:thioredoxin-related transmembrane protein 4 [Pseudophryne corroboree]|uniref:thioredoxin-related transmembrane protein 4 n=1 Tax=Pseudophryne corroboree TaxID=495146 RepID=UPI003081CDD7
MVAGRAGSRSRAEDRGLPPRHRGPVRQERARCPGGMAAVWLVAVTVLLSSLPGLSRAVHAPEGTVRAVTSSNWSALLEGQWMVTFYAPWCPACQQFQSEWESFAKQGSALNINVAKVDVTEEPGLSGRFFVTTLPTIFHAQDGVFRRYHGSRMVEDLNTFISEKKWKVLEPVAGWKSPSSILMSGMAGLFNLSGWIRQTHNYFTGPLGIPAWGSYIIFIVATLLIGLTLGLILVLLTDCFCPAKPKYEVVRSEIRKEEVEILDQEPLDTSVERKTGSDDEDAIEEEDEDEDENEDDLGEENKGDSGDNSDAEEEEEEEDSAMENSETGDEEEPSTHIPEPSTPESESALRQRKSEAVDSGH